MNEANKNQRIFVFILEERINSPNITLYPVWDGEVGVKLICTLSGYFPDTLTVEWQQDDKTLDGQQQTQNKLQSVDGEATTFTLSSEIKPDKEEWERGSQFTCKSNHNNTDFTETISICNFHWRTRPSVQVEILSLKTVMMATSEVEAVCVVQSAFKAEVTWLMDGTKASGTEKEYNRTHIVSKLKVGPNRWKQLQSVTCKAEDLCASTSEKTVSITEKNIVPPSITLYPVWDGEVGASAVKLICTLSGYFPDTLTVEWQQDDKTLDVQQQTIRKLQSVDGEATTFSLSSEISPNTEEWERGTQFKCKSTHNKKDFTKPISICKVHGRIPPSVQVEIPSLKTVMTATSEVEAVCVVQSAYKAEVTWLMDGTKATAMKKEDNKTHIVSKLRVLPDKWKQLKSVTCKAEHQCFPATEKTVPVTGVVPRPSVEIRRSLTALQQGDVVLLCNVTQLSSADLYITFQKNKRDISEKLYVSLPEAPGPHSVTREWSVNALSGMTDSFTCTVNQGFTHSVTSTPVSFDVEPSVDLFALGKDSGPQTLTCSGSGINPQIQWLSGSEKISSQTKSTSMGADGRVTISSQLQISETEWKTETDFTCKVSDVSVNKHTTKTIGFCSVAPTSSQFVSVYVHGPRAEEPQKDEQVTLTCLLVGLGLKHFSITWKVNGIHQHANIPTTQPVSHSNGTERLQSFFNISTKDWNAFKEVSCEGKHICSSQSYEDHIMKNKVIYRKPSATLLQGSHELVCLATGFSPSSINISWFVKNSKEPIYYTTEPHVATNGTFSVQSHLNLTRNTWLPGDMIICKVTHENTTLSLNATKSDILEKCLFLDEILQAEVHQDISVDSWYTTVTFLLLFLTAVVYSVGVTMVKTK